MYTSSTKSADNPAFSNAPLIAVAPRLGALMLLSAPPKLPMGVRAAPTMTTSFILLVILFRFTSLKDPTKLLNWDREKNLFE